MVLYYAFGSGLGHLTRANAVMYTLGYQVDEFIVLTSSGFANKVFNIKNIISLSSELILRPYDLKVSVESIIIEHKITVLFIDSFPAGICGELIDIQVHNCQINYIARLLNWTNYSDYLLDFKIRFDNTFVIEKLPSEQFAFIQKYSDRDQYLDLKYPLSVDFDKTHEIFSFNPKPIWLIVHSGDIHELSILYQYALDLAIFERINPNYLIISQVEEVLDLGLVTVVNYYPATDFFECADKIFTACGFNSMAQTIQYIGKHHFIPFKRRFDDQFARAANRKHLIESLK